MEILSEMCLGPRTNPLNFRYDPNYDQDRTDLHGTFTRGLSRAKEQSGNLRRGLQSLTDCLVFNDII